jgi:hypothetical protein
MLLKQLYSTSLNAGRAPQLKASVRRKSHRLNESIPTTG